ncbi:MAG: hypothetical protein ABEI75_01425 [Halobaculum sp.]
MQTLDRRRLLAAAVTGTTVGSVGCLGGFPEDAALRATETAGAGDEPQTTNAPVVVFGDLPAAERRLVRPALDGRVVRVCPSEADERGDTLRSFAGRFEPASLLRRAGTLYGVWLRIEDVVYADTADPPETDGNPCGFLS